MTRRAADAFASAQAIEDSETLEAVALNLRSFATQFGYDRFVLFSVVTTQDEAIERLYWLEGDWFSETEEVDAEAYFRRCPVTHHVFETATAFFWTKTGHGASERYRVVARPHGRGIHGLQIPVFGPSGLEGGVSLGGQQIDASRTAKQALTLVGEAALRSARSLFDAQAPLGTGRLSERERQVLRWLAAGRRQTEIAETLNLSERTVENHLRRIRIRLGAKTSAEAIRIALRNGDINQ